MIPTRTFAFWLSGIVMVGLFLVYRPALAQAPAGTSVPGQPVVHAVMFWIDTCTHCNYVRDEVLPPLQTKYQEQLKIFQIEIKTVGELDRLYQIAETLGMAKEEVGVPFLLIGDHVLKGSEQIHLELPGLIEQYLAQGGVGYPDIPLLASLLPTVLPTTQISGEGICSPSLTPCPITQEAPVVHLLVFWTLDCHACRLVVGEALPPLKDQYGEQLDVQYVDVVTIDDVDRFHQVTAALGVPEEDAHLPLILIGDHVLIGAEQIPNELPGLIEKYMAGGGAALPDIARLIEASASVEAALPDRPDGYWLAIGVITFMTTALFFTLAAILWHKIPLLPVSWTHIGLPLLALVGLGVAGYLAFVETQSVSAMCGPVGDCNAVQTSSYARLFGILPVGALGIAGYLAILVAWLYPRLWRNRFANGMPTVAFGLSLFGVLVSLYLTYLEPFVIKAVCIWCITSAVTMTLLMLFTLAPVREAIHIIKKEDNTRTDFKVETPSS